MESIRQANQDLIKYWMEYEGIGCLEILSIANSIDQLKNNENHPCRSCLEEIGKKIKLRFGQTNEKLRSHWEQVLKDGDTESIDNFKILRKSLMHYWDILKEMKWDITSAHSFTKEQISRDKKYKMTSISDDKFEKVLLGCIEEGYLSTVVEYLLAEYKFGLIDTDSASEVLEELITVLTNAQEYSLCLDLIKYIGAKHLSMKSKSLINYMKAITTKDRFQCFMLMNNLNLYSKKKCLPEEYEEKYFLIENQSAFCCAMTGQIEMAIKHEINIILNTEKIFYQHIGSLNMARLLIHRKRIDAIIPIIRGLRIVQDCKHYQGYEMIYTAYLKKWLMLLNLADSANKIKMRRKEFEGNRLFKSDYYGSSWRVAQAQGNFEDYSNYLVNKVWKNHKDKNEGRSLLAQHIVSYCASLQPFISKPIRYRINYFETIELLCHDLSIKAIDLDGNKIGIEITG
ncbi:hypothetical protein [Prochlorococcus sp. MIT 1201]|uniref:hypothetical protein n=1 Tax=Prochlorococcus sp. MIT 1201 TaxID=3082535 RepID=UPI0039A694DE